MKQVEKGLIHIADISGYTAFLNESELEHAQDSLQSLLEVLIENTHLPLVISRLEGDAVISYATEGSFLQGPPCWRWLRAATSPSAGRSN